MTRGPLAELLERDHARLDALLTRADATPGAIDGAAFEAFRAGLLRHIAIEEKLLLPAARAARGGEPLDVAARLRADHALIAALLIPSPSAATIATLRRVLTEHNPLEEGEGGLYATCERLIGDRLDALLARIAAYPAVKVAPHLDEPRVHAHIERLVRARDDGAQG